ncbi:hypothetical protein [Pseudidiomarina aestuarii]|uniref:hypothetical protein n=1 Tax=Pseudidiomarina aestuarii TaxID=624146 RepID=UPI003A96E935
MLEVGSLLVSAVLNISPPEPLIDVDVVFMVEPQATEAHSQQSIRNTIEQWVYHANHVHGVPYPRVNFQTKAVLMSGYGDQAEVIYASPISEMDSAASFIQQEIFENSKSEALQAMQRFGADLVTYVVLQPDSKGNSSGSSGNSISILSLEESTPDNWAHEAFRLVGLTKLAEEECINKDNVMCPRQELRTAFPLKVNEQQADLIHQMTSTLSPSTKRWSNITPSMPELAIAQFEVVHKVLNEEMQGRIDYRIWLADARGQEITLDERVSIEVYADSDNAEPGVHFDDGFTQRIDFLPGVSSRSVSLNIDLSGTQYLWLEVGIRYGEKLGTNQGQSYYYDHNLTFLPVPEEKSTSGGSLNLPGLLIPLAALFRRRLCKPRK